LLTEWSTRIGHGILSGILRFDVDRLVRSGVKGITNAQYAWGQLFLVNTERMTAWLLIWPAAHFTMFFVGGLMGLKQLPIAVVSPVELIPGGMLCWSVPRAGYTWRQFARVTTVVRSAEQSGEAPPEWAATKPGWRYRIVKGSDWEIAFFAALAALLAWGISHP
jgi:hypothetical protein